MGKKREYRLKLKRGKIFCFFKKFIGLFKRKPAIINLSGEELKDKAIYLSNHAGAGGPLSYELYFPKRITNWGAHEMTEGYKSRWKYLYHVFYRQKLHWGRIRAFIVACLFAPISILCYRAIGLIPTYTDARFHSTVKSSCRVLDENSALLIFPEDSSKGYVEPPASFYQGFVAMSKLYKKMRNEDVPVYNCYYSAKARSLVVSKPIYVNEMLESGMTVESITNEALRINHELYQNYILAPLEERRNKGKKAKAA